MTEIVSKRVQPLTAHKEEPLHILDVLLDVCLHVLLGVSNVLLPSDITHQHTIDNNLLTAFTTVGTRIPLAAISSP